MADKVIRVPVVAEFQTDLRSLQDIEKALSGAFEKAGTGTAIAKGLRDSLTKIRPLLKEYEQLQIQPTIDQAGVRRMNTIFDAIINEYQKRASQIEFADPEAMLPEEVLTRIRTMRAEVASLRKEMEGIEKHGASGKSDDYFQRREATAAQQDLHRRAKEALPSQYSGDATLQQNASAVEKEAAAAAQRAAALAEQGRKLAEALKQAEDGVQEAQTALRQATGDLQTATTREGKAQKAVNASKFYAALGGLTVSKTKEHAIVGGAGLRQSAFVDQSGKLQTEFQTMLRSVLQEAGIEIDVSRLIAESNASEIPGKIRQAIVDVLGDSEEAITQTLEDFKAKAQARLTRVDTEGFVKADQFLKSAREQRRAAQTTYDRAQQKAKEAPEQAFAIGYQIEENDEAQKEAQETAAALQSLSVALKEVAAAAKEAAVAAKKDEAESKEREVREVTEKEKNKVGQSLENTNRNLGATRENHQEGNRRQGEKFSQESNAQREAEDFRKSIQNAVKQWMSIQQIINIVKNGIRQAYQDIQGLDKAMTNIAVVTNMSISDLWGRINKYMSIAQQYGVTTQGVYEVSQLYYQQGLSTNEVMAATTETLKLARIAGMGYAEAADAMTVAIRSFKMDMSDAATVTDVYSKVAAITASDSEELAVAMSKTASSAESVGSSFENTTAMLAVMIETTRESAQNLGSALKSIISRYGEMKVGLTVDSEGEEIDYNKVDTALKSVGISIKDAQGQFRDFDDVIFELSEKWDSLDKNTQRYIATIMAGNRQQSRFIALVDNGERLDEVSRAAHNAEDAGLLQYAKTLDSLESKINNIKTSFQQFYMNIFNGPVVGQFLDFVNKLIQGLNQLGSFQGILNLSSLLVGLKTSLSLVGNLFVDLFGGIINDWRKGQEEMVKEAYDFGYRKAKAEQEGKEDAEEDEEEEEEKEEEKEEIKETLFGEDQSYDFGVRNEKSGKIGKHFQYKTEKRAKFGKMAGVAAGLAGTALTAVGTSMTANAESGSDLWQGAAVSAGGNALQGVSMGAAFGPWGMLIGGVLGALSGLPGILESLDKNNQAQFDYEKAKEEAEKKNIERAEKTDKYNSLKEAINSFNELKANKDNSEEDYQAWIDLNSQLAEKYPQLISYLDAEGNAIVDVTRATNMLQTSMEEAAAATKDYYEAKIREYEALIVTNKDYQYSGGANWGYGDDLERVAKSIGLWDSAQANGADLNDVDTGWFDKTNITAGTIVDLMAQKNVDMDRILDIAMGLPVANVTQLERDWVTFLTDTKIFGAENIFERNDDGKIVGWDSHINAVRTGTTGKAELEATQDEAVINAIYWQSEASKRDDKFSEVNGANAIIKKFLEKDSRYDTYDEIYNLSTKEYEAAIAPILNVYEGLSYRAKGDLSNIYDNLDSYSLVQLEKEFSRFGGANKNNPLWTSYKGLWVDQNYNKVARYGGAILGPENSFESYETWLDGREDTTAMREQYYKESLRFVNNLDEGIGNFISTHSNKVIEDYIATLESSKNLVDKGGYAGEMAQKRLDVINNVVTNLNEDGTYGNLNEAETTELLTLLNAENIGTEEWAQALEDFEAEHGIQIADFDSLVFENYNTKIERTLSTISSLNKELSEYFNKQESGFNIDEATALFKKLQKMDTSLEWGDVFDYNEKGLLVLKDFNLMTGKLYSQELQKINVMQEELTETLDTFNNILEDDTIEAFDESGNFLDAQGNIVNLEAEDSLAQVEAILTQAYGLTKEQAAYVALAIQNGTIQSEQALVDYLEGYGVILDANTDFLLKQTQLMWGREDFTEYFSDETKNAAFRELIGTPSLEGIRDYALENDLVDKEEISVTDEEGNVTTYYEYDWGSFFEDFEGIEIDKYGEIIIKDPVQYAESMIDILEVQDQEVINDIYQSVFEQYHIQWQQRQSELKTLFEDFQFTGEEVAKMFAWAVGNGLVAAESSMESFATSWGLEEVDGVWEATNSSSYYKIMAYAMAENPDLDFSDLPTWDEWVIQKAEIALKKREKAIKFLKELVNKTGPESLNEAIELGLLSLDTLTEAEISAFENGNISVVDLIEAHKDELDPKLLSAWEYGQANAAIETANWLIELIKKSTLTPQELLEIWELIGSPNGEFENWVENNHNAFIWDAVNGSYRIGAGAYDIYAQAAAAKGATEMPSRLGFLQTLHAEEKEQSDARVQALSSLSVDATIHDLDAVYQAGLITDKQYLQAIADAAAGRKTYYESILENVDRTNKEIDDAIQEVKATQAVSALTDADNLFSDMILDNDSIKKMWLDADTEQDMFSWAEEALGIVYKNGEWIIGNIAQAWAAMKGWYEKEYGDDYEAYMPVSNETEFRAMWANYQDTQDEAIISFLEGLSPESGEDILAEAVELGIATWTDINTYKQKGYDAYSTIRAIVKGKGNSEWQSTLEKGYKNYYQESFNQIENIFSDGLFTEEELEGMWLADTDFTGSFDSWIGQFTQGENAFFEKVGDGWIIKSEEAYDEMVQWIADTYGPEFVAALPSYKKLESMGILEGKRREEDVYDFISSFDFEDVDTDDLEKAVELGIISQDELNWAIQNNVDFSALMLTAFGRMNGNAAKALGKAQAAGLDKRIQEANDFVEKTTWSSEEIFDIFGELPTDSTGTFELDLTSGEWKIINKEAYEDLQTWVEETYGTAYKNMLPSYEELQQLQVFEDTKTKKERLDIINNLSYEFSLNDLEKLVEAGMLTYQEAMTIWSSANPWETLLSTIKLSSQEELDAFNQMVTKNNIAMGEAALALFNDSSLTWDEVSTLWANQLGEGGETDIVKWAQSMGLEFIDGEWKITTEEAYNNMVAAAKELYGEAWAAMVPSKDDILAANLLDEQVTYDSKVNFIEGLNFEEITASDMQKAIEQGIITSEQLMWAQENGIDYQTLIGMAISHDQEMVQAFNEGLAEYNLTQRENMMTLFDDNVLSQEQVIQMWHDMGSGQTFDSWLAGSGIEFIDGEFRIDSAAAFNTVKEWAKTYWGEAWNSIPWSTITAEQWEAGMADIKAMETDAAIESFFSDFDANAGMDEAYKAVELGLLTQEQLLHGLAQGFSVWDIVTSYALESAENYSDFIDMINNRTRAEYLSSAFSLGTADSLSSDQIISLWDLNGRTKNSNFIDWAQDNGFIINESGQWEASTKEAYQNMLDYIGTTFGAAYANALPTANEWEAANLLEKAKTDSDRTDFIKGLTADADVAEILQQAIDYGILDLNDYINEEGKLELPSRDQLFADIGANLRSQEDVDAFNEAMFLINQDRVDTVSSLMEDNSFTGSELYEIWKKTAQTGVSFSDWLKDVGFILQKDGTYKAMGEAAYDVMVSYVRDNFGEAFVALLPTKEDWENSKFLEDFHSEMDMGEFLSGLNVNATIDDLDKAAELFGITYTEDQLNAIKDGSKTVYEVILESLAPEGWVDGVFGRTGPMADVINEIERMNRDALIAELPFGELLTTAEDFTSAAQTLAALGFDEDRYKEILADGRIGLEDTIAILEESQYYLDTVIFNDNDEAENAGEALFAAAQAYGLSLESFFEMEVYSPALILERLGLQLDQLTAEQYDSFRAAQSSYAESVSKLFSGTGSATDMEKLLATINYGRDADEQWDYSAFYETAEGIQLDRSKFFEALSILKEQDWELYSSIRETLVSSPELLGESFDSIMEVQQAINELGLEHTNLLEEQNAALREQASIYGEIYAQMSMNKSEGWDFLNAELHGNAQNFTSWGESVRSTFEQLGNKDGIEPTAFINMLNYMQQMGTTVETLGGNFASWGELMTSAYSAFGKAIVTGTNVTVDDLGISTKNMTSAMFESMQKTARQQVDFLDGQIAMLEGIKAISDIDEGELSIGSIYQTMADEVSKYNAETGSDIKLDNIFITVGGERFSFTEEGIAKAEEKYNTLFADSGISFEHALQTSLGNNFGVVMEGGTIGITPTGVMEVELSVDGAAITDSLSETNGYLTNINSSLITIVGLLSTGKNPWTAEGAAAYFTDEEGNSVIPQTPEELREWYANLDPISQAIYRNYEKTSGIPFEYSPIASADGYQEGEYGKNIYTITTADGEKITGQQVVIETIDGKATPTYATGLDESGKGVAYMALPENPQDWWRNNGAIGQQYTSLLDKGYFQDGEHWYRLDSDGSKISVDNTDEVKAYNASLETYLSSAEATPWVQALYYTMTGQPEKVPGYGVSGKGYTTPDPSTPVNVNTLLQTTNNELGTIASNTAEAAALLAVMAQGLDLNTPEGQWAYLEALGYSRFTSNEARQEWMRNQSDFTLDLIQQMHNHNPSENWAESNAAVAMRVDWERNGLPIEDEMAQQLWTETYSSDPNGQYAWAREYIVQIPNAPIGNTMWDYDNLFKDPRFIQAMVDTHGQEIYEQTSSNNDEEPPAPELIESEIAVRNAWWGSETLTDDERKALLAGVLGVEDPNSVNLNDYKTTETYTDGNGTTQTREVWDYDRIKELLYGKEAFETAFAGGLAEATNLFPNKITEYRELAADADFYSKYGKDSEGNWREKGTNGELSETVIIDEKIIQRLNSIAEKDEDNDGSLTNELGEVQDSILQLAAIMGVQLDPNFFANLASTATTQDAILRTTQQVNEAMARLVTTMDNVDSVLQLVSVTGINPQIGGYSLNELQELVDQEVITQDQLNGWIQNWAVAYTSGDEALIERANSDINAAVAAEVAENDAENTQAGLEEEIRTLTENNSTLAEEITVLRNENDQLDADLSAALTRRDEVQSQVTSLTGQLQSATEREGIALRNFQTAQADLANASGALSSTKAALDAANEQLDYILQYYGENSPEYTRAVAEKERAEHEYSQALANYEAAQREANARLNELNQVRAEKAAIQEELNNKKTELNRLNGTIRDLREDISYNEGEIISKNRIITAQEERIAELTRQIGVLENDLSEARNSEGPSASEVATHGANYSLGMAAMAAGDYAGAIEFFEATGTFLDSAEQLSQAQYLYAQQLMSEGRFDEAGAILQTLQEKEFVVPEGELTIEILIKENEYQRAERLLATPGKRNEAIELFASLGDYSGDNGVSGSDRAKQLRYEDALALYNSGDYEGAAAAFAALGDFSYNGASASEYAALSRQKEASYTASQEYTDFLGTPEGNPVNEENGYIFQYDGRLLRLGIVPYESVGYNQYRNLNHTYGDHYEGRMGNSYEDSFGWASEPTFGHYKDPEYQHFSFDASSADHPFVIWMNALREQGIYDYTKYMHHINLYDNFHQFERFQLLEELGLTSGSTYSYNEENGGIVVDFDRDLYLEQGGEWFNVSLLDLILSGNEELASVVQDIYHNLEDTPESQERFAKAMGAMYEGSVNGTEEADMLLHDQMYRYLPYLELSREQLSPQGQEILDGFYSDLDEGAWGAASEKLNILTAEFSQIEGFDLTPLNQMLIITQGLAGDSAAASQAVQQLTNSAGQAGNEAANLAGNLNSASGAAANFASSGGGGGGGYPMYIMMSDHIPLAGRLGLGFYTGNVSGLAFAEGNGSLDRLNIGARLAGKTLVGELGPELAVYDGMYHLLGQNGAEFVDLPSNAIVFNHRQTAGIIRGQIGYRGTALAEGNADDLIAGEAFAEGHITGPARASIDDTISQLKGLRAMWQNILDMDASQLAAAGGGGGGGGNSLKATTADLEEWYNLLRQIEQIEQDITNLEAKRANIYDGSDYLKNLRETQKLLEKQRLTQQILLEYQQKQLEAQAKFINEHAIWSKFLTVGEDGLLQYIEGNEEVGGKGAIKVLQMLNDMSGKEQEKFVKNLGYSAADDEGKALEGEKLVARFYEELQDQIDQYDELYETVHTTNAELEDLTSQIEDINREVVENQKELETDLYDIIVEAWEEEIEQLEKQKGLIEEMNDAYTKGLKDALSAEKDLYQDNQSIEERESLQRQLALLRRSGGSASEIADLEEQLNDSLKDEYFANQEKMIENIEDANERQVKKLEEQIKLQQEALEYEKENGVIWSKVYEVLEGSQEEILAFMQGDSTDFFSKSALEQEEMLLNWAKKIGIYSEDQQYKTAMTEAEKHWNSDGMWNGKILNGLQDEYDKLTDEQKASLGEYFKSSYSSAYLNNFDKDEARRIAEENVKAVLDKDSNTVDWSNLENGAGEKTGDGKVYYGGYTAEGKFESGWAEDWGNAYWVAKNTKKILVDKEGYFKTSSSEVSPWKKWYIEDGNGNKLSATGYATKEAAEAVINKYKKIAEDNQKEIAQSRAEGTTPQITPLTEEELRYTRAVAKLYSKGGLVDYTGVAIVHGSKSKPEAFLNASQTAQIKEALQATNGKENLLSTLHSTVDQLRSLIHNISTINSATNNNITIAPGAVVINVDELADSYDVEALSADIMNRMVAIASKATNRGVNRR